MKTFPTLAAAKTWRQDALVALRTGSLTPVCTATLADALDDLIAGMATGRVLDRTGKAYKPATVRSYRRAVDGYLKPRLGRLRLADVRRRDVQDFVDRLRAKDELAPSTIHNKIDPLRVLYRRALHRDEVTTDPTHGLELPANRGKRDTIASPAEAEKLLAALPTSERALWAVAFYAGLRIGELRALRWARIDFDAGVIRVERGWDDVEGEIDVKTGAGRRVVPLAGAVRRELAAHKLRTGRDGDDLVFGRTAALPFVRSTLARSRGVEGRGPRGAHATRGASLCRQLPDRRWPECQAAQRLHRPQRHPHDVQPIRTPHARRRGRGGAAARRLPRRSRERRCSCVTSSTDARHPPTKPWYPRGRSWAAAQARLGGWR